MCSNTHRKPISWIKNPWDQQLISIARENPEKIEKYSFGWVWKIVHDTYMTLSKTLNVIYSDMINLVLYHGSLDLVAVSELADDYWIPSNKYYLLYEWIRTSTLRLEPIRMTKPLYRTLIAVAKTSRYLKHCDLLVKYWPQEKCRLGWGEAKRIEMTRIWRGLYEIYKTFANIVNSYICDTISDMIIITSGKKWIMEVILQKYIKIHEPEARRKIIEWIRESLRRGVVQDTPEIEGIVSGNDYKHAEIVMEILRTARESRKRSCR